MEEITRPRGDPNEIITHDDPTVYDGSTTAAPPPVTFDEAERLNPYALLVDLHDHALTATAEHGRPRNTARSPASPTQTRSQAPTNYGPRLEFLRVLRRLDVAGSAPTGPGTSPSGAAARSTRAARA